VKALRILGGSFCLLFAYAGAKVLLRHWQHPGEAGHTGHLLASAGLCAVLLWSAWSLLSGAFMDPRRASADGSAPRVVGAAQLETTPGRLTLRPVVRSRVGNLITFGIGLLVFGAGLPVSFARHAWVWFGLSLLIVAFDLFMVVFTLSRWNDVCVWDRAADQFLCNDVPTRALSEIAGVEVVKRAGVHHADLLMIDGTRLPVSKTLGAFGKAEDAERFRAALLSFLHPDAAPVPPGVAGVWPPPPTPSRSL